MSQSALFLRLRMLVISVFAFGTLLMPLAGSAQSTSGFGLNSVVRQCSAPVVDLSWTAYGDISSITISVSNTSSNWSDQTVLNAPTSNSYSYTFDHHAIDKVVVRAVMVDAVPTEFQYTADVGMCGMQGAMSGGKVGSETSDPDISISIENATCSGFNWRVQAPYDVRVYVSTSNIIGHGLIPFVPVNGSDVSRSETYVVDSEDDTWFGISIRVHDIDTEQELARQSLTMTCPIAPVPNVTPAVTPAVTPDDDDSEPTVSISIELPGGASIVGAPYSVFAPMAAEFLAEPYLQGVVGLNNTIELVGLMPGDYRLLIEPLGMDPIDVVFTVGSNQVTEIVLQIGADGNVVVVPRQPVQNPTAAPAESSTAGTGTTPAQPASSVDALPTTGVGGMQMGTPILMLGLLVAMLGMVGLVVRRGYGAER